MLVFAGISVFVGAFLDLQHLLDHGRAADQRVRDAADLGASSRQVLASVIVEALLLGVAASPFGIGLGFGSCNWSP
ncbi:MAG: hypothetical protein U0R24_11150 [Solirubrobacterales bacterium]